MLDEDHRRLLGAFVRARREAVLPDRGGRRRRTPACAARNWLPGPASG